MAEFCNVCEETIDDAVRELIPATSMTSSVWLCPACEVALIVLIRERRRALDAPPEPLMRPLDGACEAGR